MQVRSSLVAVTLASLALAAAVTFGGCNATPDSSPPTPGAADATPEAATPDASTPDADIGTCPNASDAAPLGDFYRYDAVPRGLACTADTSCTIAVHDCPNDWPFDGLGLINVYTCKCPSGTWECTVTSPGGGTCPGFPPDAGPGDAGGDGSLDAGDDASKDALPE